MAGAESRVPLDSQLHVGTRRIRGANRRIAGAIASQVFSEDGMFRVLFPEPSTRPAGVDQLHRNLLATIPKSTTTSIATVNGQLVGCSLWVPPGNWPYPTSFYRREAFQAKKLTRSFGLDAEATGALMTAVASEHPREPHWYLQLVMVSPQYQGRGLGDALVAPGLEAADREGLPCFLETQAIGNLAYYARLGFEQVAETTDPTGVGTLWSLLRPPRR